MIIMSWHANISHTDPMLLITSYFVYEICMEIKNISEILVISSKSLKKSQSYPAWNYPAWNHRTKPIFHFNNGKMWSILIETNLLFLVWFLNWLISLSTNTVPLIYKYDALSQHQLIITIALWWWEGRRCNSF